MNVVCAIGNTSTIRLRKVVPPECAQVWAKLEWENPPGSVNDRMATAVISRVEEDGRLKPEARVVTLMADSGLKNLNTDRYGNR